MLVCHFTSKQLYAHIIWLWAVSLLLKNLRASAIIIYVSMWTVKPGASSFAGASTNETRDLLQYRAYLEIF